MDKKTKILCIDDLEENLRIRTLMLQAYGFQTLVAYDHISALRLVSSEHPGLLVIDYHLANGETGENVARDVRIISPDTPLIMLSGDPTLPESVHDCDAVLTKGSGSPADLLATIRRLLTEAGTKSAR